MCVIFSPQLDTMFIYRNYSLCIQSKTSVQDLLCHRRVSRGEGPAPPPPLEIEKQKKRSSEQILSYFTYILLLFKSKYDFLGWGPPLEKLKSKKKAQILGPPPPPPGEFLDTRLCHYL